MEGGFSDVTQNSSSAVVARLQAHRGVLVYQVAFSPRYGLEVAF
jgi:hypothetical protein